MEHPHPSPELPLEDSGNYRVPPKSKGFGFISLGYAEFSDEDGDATQPAKSDTLTVEEARPKEDRPTRDNNEE